jgi:hypothetical protein
VLGSLAANGGASDRGQRPGAGWSVDHAGEARAGGAGQRAESAPLSPDHDHLAQGAAA